MKGFLVPTDTPGLRAQETTGKVALRILENTSVVLEGCRVPESHRLQQVDSFRTTAEVLGAVRAGAA